MTAGTQSAGGSFQCVRDCKVIDCSVEIQTGVARSGVEAASKRNGELSDETMVGYAKITKFEREPDEVCDEVRSVNAAVDEDGTIYVGVVCRRVNGRLSS